jgi:hypothetical protein
MVYKNTFIQIAPDSEATSGSTPESNRKAVPIHMIEYQLLSENPYRFDHEELIFEVFLMRQSVSDEERA